MRRRLNIATLLPASMGGIRRPLSSSAGPQSLFASAASSSSIAALQRWGILSASVTGMAPTQGSWLFSGKGGSGSGDNNNNGGNNNKDGGNNKGEGGDEDKPAEDEVTPKIARLVAGTIFASCVLYWFSWPSGSHVSWAAVDRVAEKVNSITIYEQFAQVYTEDGPLYVGVVNDRHTNDKVREIKNKLPEDKELFVDYAGQGFAESMLHLLGTVAWVAPFIFFPGFVLALTHSMGQAAGGAEGAAAMTKKGKQFIVHRGSSTRFKDIAGMKEAKREITEIVDFLKQPERYTKLGAKIPTGALLLGPPGTGKTLLAKAVAGEAGVAFIPTCGSDFVELYVGMGALRVRQLFETARKQPCIIYIDEIDAIGMKRSGKGTGGEATETENTLNELLTQLDGFGTERGKVMILASSNVGKDQLDKALIRPGRFDRLVHVDSPVISERIEIFKVHLRNLLLMEEEKQFMNDKDFVTNQRTEGVEEKKTEETATDAAASATPQEEAKKEEGEVTKAVKTPEEEEGAKKAEGEAAAKPKAEDDATKKAATTDSAAKPKEDDKPVIGGVPALIPDANADANAFKISDELKAKGPGSSNRPMTNEQVFENIFAKISQKPIVEIGNDGKPIADGTEKKMSAEEIAVRERKEQLITAFATRMSDLCPGFVGADIANVCNEAAILAAREEAPFVTIAHLERSIDRVLAGIEHRSRVLSGFEKKVVAHHEAGHAVAGWFLNRADPLMKVSIVPRGGSALGYAQYLPNENQLRTSQEIRDSICVTLGGRVAEQIFFNHLSTGASDDLQKVCRMAYSYVSNFDTKVAHPPQGTEQTKYIKPFGARVSDKMDVTAKELVDELYDKTVALLTKHKADMEKLAAHLMEHEMLTHADVVKYLGDRENRSSDRKKAV